MALQTWKPIKDPWFDFDSDWDFFFPLVRKGAKDKKEQNLAHWAPAIDVSETAEAIKIVADLPGLTKQDVKLEIEEGMLTIRGERKFEQEEKKKDFHRIERSYGTFSRSFHLPETVDVERINAKMNEGVLEVIMPKREEAVPQTKQIEIG